MEDQISQSFKIKWITSTLKYLKDDKQLIMKYPAMPVTHMEYLHNLISQRKHNIGFGFKSMYAPVWEAMKNLSLKYKFKVFSSKSEDHGTGYLVIEKIPKTQENADETMQENEYVEDIGGGTGSNETQTEIQSQSTKPKTTKAKKKRTSKSEKFVIDKQKIIESISPALLRRNLQSILDFLLKEEEASIVFADIAPIEAKFLENFLGIYNKRQTFQANLSPACNELLDRMGQFFQVFDKRCKLEVYAATYNLKTRKREVTFMKAPRYTTQNVSQTHNKCETPKINTEINHCVNINSNNLSVPKHIEPNRSIENSNLKITIAIDNVANASPVDRRQVQMPVHTRDNELIDNTVGNREVKLTVNKQAKENRFVDNVDCRAVDNEQRLKQETDKIKDKSKMLRQKAKGKDVKRTTKDNKKLPTPPNTSRKEKLLEAMSTPLESDKAMRMMRLMGWEGGALGLRGEGIVEPIIPALHIKPGQGLGHVAAPAPPPRVPASRVGARADFLNTALELITGDASVASVTYRVTLSGREMRCFRSLVEMLNRRQRFDLTAGEGDTVERIGRAMENRRDLMLDMFFTNDFKELTITKSLNNDTKTRETQEKTNQHSLSKEMKLTPPSVNIKSLFTINQFKTYICSSVLHFMKTDELEKEIDFNATLPKKYANIVELVCSCVNNKVLVPYEKIKDLCTDILNHTKGCYLDVQFDTKQNRSIVLRKCHYKKRVKKPLALQSFVNSTIPETSNNTDHIHEDNSTVNIKPNDNTYKDTTKPNVEVDRVVIKTSCSEPDHVNDPSKTPKEICQQKGVKRLKIADNNETLECPTKIIVTNEENSNLNETNKHIDTQKTDAAKDINIQKHHIDDSTNVEKNFTFSLYAKQNILTTDNNNDPRIINIDLMKLTIRSLTENKKNSKLEIITDNIANIDKGGKMSESNDDCRKWYEPSEKFLICKNTSVNKIDSNNNGS